MNDLRKKLKSMNIKQQLIYLWDYYAAQTAIIIAVTSFIIYMISNLFSGKELIFSGIVLNCLISEEGEEYLTSEFFDRVHGNPKKDDVDLVTNVFIQEGAENVDNARILLEAKLMAREIDYMILDESAMNTFIQKDALADVREIVDEDALLLLSDHLRYEKYTNPENGSDYVAAISLESTEFSNRFQIIPQDSYLVFAVNGKNLDKASEFIKHIWDI